MVVIDFLKHRVMCYVISWALILAGVVGYVMNGGFSYHIDFVGGTELQVAFEQPLDAGALRSALTEGSWKDATIQSVGSTGKTFLVKIGKDGATVEKEFLDIASKQISGNPAKVEHVAWVGAEVGSDIKQDAIIAILLGLLSILVYVGFRWQFSYALGAVVALAHDILIVLGVFAITGDQISLNVLAALLMILGYSINDTIIIYSRIQENLAKKATKTLYECINLSTTQTLRRTILTSSATLLSVLAIYLLGGEALRGFSLAMMLGIIVGTYSSIYMASPIMCALEKDPA